MSNSTAKIPTFFKTPFFPAYWRQAAKEMKQLRIMVVAALFIALDIVLGLVVIPVGENL